MLISNTNPSHTYPKKLLLEQTHNEHKIGFKFHSRRPLPLPCTLSLYHTNTCAHTHILALFLSLEHTHADPQFILSSLPLFSIALFLTLQNTHTLSLSSSALSVCSRKRSSIVLGETSWGALGDTL